MISAPEQVGQEIGKMNDGQVDDLTRELCRTNLKYLCTQILGMKDWDRCHDDLAEFLRRSEKNKKLILMPRGHLKTSIVTIGKSIQHILNDPDTTILYLNAVQSNAESFLSEAKDYLTTKSLLPLLFGHFASWKWNETSIVVRQRTRANKTPTASVAGADKALASQHYDVIFVDDLVNRQTIGTRDQIANTRKVFSDVLDLLNPGGTLYYIGTRWDEWDIYGTIIEDFADAFDVYNVSATNNGEIDGEVVFPKKFSTSILKELLKEKGSYEFGLQYLNRVTPRTSQHFKPPFRYWTEIPAGSAHVITVDLAISEDDNADYTVILDTVRFPSGQWAMVEYMRGHLGVGEILEGVFKMVQKTNQPTVRVGVESVLFQKVYAHLIDGEKIKRGMRFQVIPVQQTRDKFSRIMSLQPLWEQGNWLLKQGMVEAEQEFLSFPSGKNDDILDACEMAPRVLDSTYKVFNSKYGGAWIPQRYRDENINKRRVQYIGNY